MKQIVYKIAARKLETKQLLIICATLIIMTSIVCVTWLEIEDRITQTALHMSDD